MNERFPADWLEKWLRQYDFISVREQSGVEKLSSFLNYNMKITIQIILLVIAMIIYANYWTTILRGIINKFVKRKVG